MVKAFSMSSIICFKSGARTNTESTKNKIIEIKMKKTIYKSNFGL